MLACIWYSIHIYIYTIWYRNKKTSNQILISINESIYGLFKTIWYSTALYFYCIILYQWSLETSRILCQTPSGWLCEGHAATRGAVLGPSWTPAAWWRSPASVVSHRVIQPGWSWMGIPLDSPFLLRHGPSCNCSSGFGMWKLWLRKLLQGKWQGIKLRRPASHRKKVPGDMASISGGMKEWKAMVILSDFKNWMVFVLFEVGNF